VERAVQQPDVSTQLEYLQLFDPASSTYSYLLWDRKTREAAFIDPVLDQLARDTQLVREYKLLLKYTLETHVHADHVTSAGQLRERFNSIVLVHENSRTKCADVLIKDGDFIPLGSCRINVLYTPRHTDSDVCYLIPGAVFTGDTLLIGGCGRTDFQSGDAGTLYDSITQQLFTLPDSTMVYPGHDYHGRRSSTIAEERRNNPRAGNGNSRDEFISIMNNLRLEPPQRIHEALPSNLRCGLPVAQTP
jgi:glyoxylase-like metal-dependent hydrolase (beta-lactamase superfamily II)